MAGGLESHKNIRFFSNAGLDPLGNYKATKLVLHDGPSLARQ